MEKKQERGLERGVHSSELSRGCSQKVVLSCLFVNVMLCNEM